MLLCLLGAGLNVFRSELAVLKLRQEKFADREKIYPGERARRRATSKARMRSAWVEVEAIRAELVSRGVLCPEWRASA